MCSGYIQGSLQRHKPSISPERLVQLGGMNQRFNTARGAVDNCLLRHSQLQNTNAAKF